MSWPAPDGAVSSRGLSARIGANALPKPCTRSSSNTKVHTTFIFFPFFNFPNVMKNSFDWFCWRALEKFGSFFLHFPSVLRSFSAEHTKIVVSMLAKIKNTCIRRTIHQMEREKNPNYIIDAWILLKSWKLISLLFRKAEFVISCVDGRCEWFLVKFRGEDTHEAQSGETAMKRTVAVSYPLWIEFQMGGKERCDALVYPLRAPNTFM